MTAVSIAERILDTFPSGSYGLLALLRLLDIVGSDEVETAAVECTSMPRLLINPQFVEAHAATADRRSARSLDPSRSHSGDERPGCAGLVAVTGE